MRQPCLNKFALFCKGRKLKISKYRSALDKYVQVMGEKTSCNMFMYLKTGLHRSVHNSPKDYDTSKSG